MKKIIQKFFGVDKLINNQELQLEKQKELIRRITDIQNQMVDIQRNQKRI